MTTIVITHTNNALEAMGIEAAVTRRLNTEGLIQDGPITTVRSGGILSIRVPAREPLTFAELPASE